MPDHLDISSTQSRIALITGDPARVPIMAEYFDEPRRITDTRGFVCFEARCGESPVLLVATGIGAPSTAIVVEELVELGVTCIVRLGTCGALQPHVKPHELIVSTASVRDEGTTCAYIDPGYPAVADHVLLTELLAAAERRGISTHVGVTHSKDAYYSERREKQVDAVGQARRWETWRRAGVLATEMETAALFVLGSLRSIRAGAVLISVGPRRDAKAFRTALERALHCIQDAVRSLVAQELIADPSTGPAERDSFLDRGDPGGR